MPDRLPDLDLTLGQVLWAIGYGREPNRVLRDQVRYLRLLDIPPAPAAQASGPGNRIRYGFNDLVELGLAVTALDHGFRPKDIAAVLVKQRKEMRKLYKKAWLALPEQVLSQSWVRSRGELGVMLDEELYLRLHDRRSEKWGELDFVSAKESSNELPILEPVERFGNGPPRRLIPLKRLIAQWVVWAMEAPEIKPGRR